MQRGAPWIVIEAEDFAVTSPGPPDGARARSFPWASGRAALIRFPLSDETTWKVKGAESGAHELWLRYTLQNARPLAWKLGSEEWTSTECPPTEGLAGQDAWSWQLLGEVELDGVASNLSVKGAPMRLDCFLLRRASGAQGRPEWPPAREASELTTDVRETLAALPARSAPGWFDDAAAIELPPWIEETRVALHTRLSVAWTDKPLFTAAEARAVELGAPAITRFVRAHNGDCFWRSSTGAVADWVEALPEDEPDPVEAMAARARALDLGFIAYLRHGEDGPLAREHPEWTCRDLEGRPIEFAGHPRLCFHSPYGDVVRRRIGELSERGAQGVYLDETHQPLDGCWCDWTARAFTKATGLPMPTSRLAEDPLYRRFLAFSEDSLAAELWRWRTEVREAHPGFVFLVSTNLQPNLMGPRPTLRLGIAGDVIKTEFEKGASPDPLGFLKSHPELGRFDEGTLLAFGWVQSRDGAFGRPAHVWMHALGSEERWKAATAAVVASGCLANLDQAEATMGSSDELAAAFRLGRTMGASLAHARPWRACAIHLPERARNRSMDSPERAWNGNMAPAVAAFSALLEGGYPTSVVSDDQLAEGWLDGVEVLFLPNADGLEPRQRAAVAAFRARGGVVVEESAQELRRACEDRAWPYRLSVPSGVQAHHFRGQNGEHLIALANDPEWIRKPGASAPAEVRKAKVLLRAEQAEVEVLGQEVSKPKKVPGGAEIVLPPFSFGQVIRVRLPKDADTGR
ncbi:hypothetical protein Poly30_54780 [Planctomycetes bacterium Poly30]|uniref:Glycoside hydrolase family 42 N-terminal domain-containing protein n=1 Tax=Saltatorellus ferox TaxID=2528018 RepID=A0A518F0P6_9BACT|nr:hypothetical protein Poly30_54780 [Planctomycetes bacterium Poly30]